jgi:hypothetical protein
MIQMDQYTYPSSLDASSIRLVKLLRPSSTNTETPHLLIDKFNLNEFPAYHALSYTWGPPEDDAKEYDELDKLPILLAGSRFNVFPNLYDVLMQLQEAQLDIYYWIDAICINQDDIPERERQVGVMDQIYKNAEQVVIWLGKDNQQAAEVTKVITKLGEISEAEVERMYEEKQAGNLYDFEDEAVMQKYGLPPLNEVAWEGVIAFFERRWFKRIWILQEVALARESVALWGSTIIPWQVLSSCSQFLTVSNLSRGLAELQQRSYPTRSHVAQIGTSIGAIYLIQQLCRGRSTELDEEYRVVLERMTGSADVSTSTSHFLLFLLLLSRPFQSTDLRDKLFALLGIMNHFSAIEGLPPTRLEPDYSAQSTPATVFTNAATAILEATRHLGLLTTVTDDSLKKISNLPSWVPDFTTVGPNPMLTLVRSEDNKPFDASRYESIGSLGFRVEGHAIHVKAFELGKIAVLSEACLDMLHLGQFEECAKLLLQADPIYGATGQSRVEVLWRTLIHDQDDFVRPAPSHLARSFHHWVAFVILKGVGLASENNVAAVDYLRGLSSIKKLADADSNHTIPDMEYLRTCCKKLGLIEEDNSYTEEDDVNLRNELMQGLQAYQAVAFASLPYRRILLTEEGHIASGPQSMQVGDRVWIVSGCPSPLVLRAHSQGRSCYRLLGEAYVHGAMYGETVTDDVGWEDLCLV